MSEKDRDDAKAIVLARRAKFVAAAVAGVGIACGKTETTPPQPCLSVAYVPDAAPQPCLSPVAVPPDAAADAGPTDAGPSDASVPIPVPCLSVILQKDAGPAPPSTKTAPMPCLSPPPMKKDPAR